MYNPTVMQGAHALMSFVGLDDLPGTIQGCIAGPVNEAALKNVVYCQTAQRTIKITMAKFSKS